MNDILLVTQMDPKLAFLLVKSVLRARRTRIYWKRPDEVRSMDTNELNRFSSIITEDEELYHKWVGSVNAPIFRLSN